MQYLHLVRHPEQALSDGTYDYFVEFIRRHQIRVHEWEDVEGWIRWYNKNYLNRFSPIIDYRYIFPHHRILFLFFYQFFSLYAKLTAELL